MFEGSFCWNIFAMIVVCFDTVIFRNCDCIKGKIQGLQRINGTN